MNTVRWYFEGVGKAGASPGGPAMTSPIQDPQPRVLREHVVPASEIRVGDFLANIHGESFFGITRVFEIEQEEHGIRFGIPGGSRFNSPDYPVRVFRLGEDLS